MSLALSICLLFISLMQSVNDAQFLNTTSLFLLFGATTLLVFGTAIVPLTVVYASLKPHKLDFPIQVLTLI